MASMNREEIQDADLEVLTAYPGAPTESTLARIQLEQPGPYLVLDSAFHHGGVLARHRSLRSAVKSSRRIYRHHKERCACGQGHIVPESRARRWSPDMHYSEPCK